MSPTHKKGARRDDDAFGTSPSSNNNFASNKKQKKASTNTNGVEPLPGIIPQEALENDVFASDSARATSVISGAKFTAVAFNVAGSMMLKSKPRLRMIVDKAIRCLMFSEPDEPGKCGGGNETVETVLARVCDSEVCVFDGEKGYAGVCILARWMDKDS